MPKGKEGAASAAPDLPPHAGTVSRACACVYRGHMLTFSAGQRVEGDASLAAYLAEHKLPITWDDPQ